MLPPYFSVFLVLGLLLAALWWARRKGLAASDPFTGRRAPKAERRLRVVERLPLTAQHSLHLVSFDGRLLLVGVSPAGIASIGESGAAAAANPAPFAAALDAATAVLQ